MMRQTLPTGLHSARSAGTTRRIRFAYLSFAGQWSLCLLIFLITFYHPLNAQLFQQDFNSVPVISTYTASPSGTGTFDDIHVSGSGMSVFIDSGVRLSFQRLNAGTGAFTKKNLANNPGSLIIQFDLNAWGNTAGKVFAANWQIGEGLNTNPEDLSGNKFHSSFYLDFKPTANQYMITDGNVISLVPGSSNNFASFIMTGANRITWVINNSGAVLSYRAPDGSNATVGNDQYDLWVGNVSVADDVDANYPTKKLEDFKFSCWDSPTGNTVQLDHDNILIDQVPAIPLSLPATSISNYGFTARWNAAAGVTGYRIDVAKDSLFTDIVLSNVYIAGQASDSIPLSGLQPGATYYYRVRGAKQYAVGEFGSGNSATQTLTTPCTPAEPAGSIAISANLVCNSTTLSYPAGSGSIKYYWQTNANGTDTTLASDGSYNYTVNISGRFYIRAKDTVANCWSAGSLASDSVRISHMHNPLVTADTSVCLDAASPLLTFHVSGGIRPYQFNYRVNGGVLQNLSSGLSSDTASIFIPTNTSGNLDYTLESVTDSLGCNLVVGTSRHVVVHPLPLAVMSGSDTTCAGASAVPLLFSGSNGTAPYQFTYSINGQASQQTPFTASGQNTLSILQSTGTPGAFFYQLLSVVDSNGCAQNQGGNANVLILAAPSVSITVQDHSGVSTSDGILCDGDSATLTAFGTGTYVWSDGSTGNSITIPSALISGISATYTVTATNGGICSSSQTVTLIKNNLPVASIAGSTAVCRNAVSPNLIFTGSNGSRPYQFSYRINGGSIQTIQGNTISDSITLPVPTGVAGTLTYELIAVNDANACGQAQSAIATVLVRPQPAASISGSDTLCESAGSTPVSFQASGGTSPYTFTYQVNNGLAQSATTTIGDSTLTLSQANNIPGTYVYYLQSVQDANGCTQNQSASTIVKIDPLPSGTMSAPALACQGSAASFITLTGTNATAPYTFYYTINGGATNTVSTSAGSASVQLPVNTLVSGTENYSLTMVTDQQGCSQSLAASAVVDVKPLPTATVSGDTAVCGNTPSPVITFTGSNGHRPYLFSYRINGGSLQYISTTSNSNSVQLPVPTQTDGVFAYNLTGVQDSFGCMASLNDTAFITVRPLPQAAISGSNTVCTGSANLQPIVLTGSNASRPYTFTYALNGGSLDTVSSAAGTDTAHLNGSSAIPGTFVYSLFTVSDAHGCNQTQAGAAVISVNQSLVASISASDHSGNSFTDGIICEGDSVTLAATAPGGYTYLWLNNNSTTATQTITSGNFGANDSLTYSVIVSDNGACPSTASITIKKMSLPSGSISGDAIVCRYDSAAVVFTGIGTPPFTFNYKINSSALQTISSVSSTATVLANTNNTIDKTFYLKTVSDSSGCVSPLLNYTALVQILPLPSATISGSDTTCLQPGGSLPVSLLSTIGTKPITFFYSINGIAQDSVTTAGADTSIILQASMATAGLFNYNLTRVTDSNGCSRPLNGHAVIKINPLPTATISGTDTICQGAAVPAITLIGANGSRPYLFTYKRNGLVNTISSAPGSDQSVIYGQSAMVGTDTFELLSVKDANACEQAQSGQVFITVKPIPDASIAGSDTLCAYAGGSSPVTFTGLGGQAPYQFTYTSDGGLTFNAVSSGVSLPLAIVAASISNPGNYPYKLTQVSDVFGCSHALNDSIHVLVNPAVSGSVTAIESSGNIANDGIVCRGDTVILQALPASASTYLWNTGSATDTVLIASGLLPGDSTAYSVVIDNAFHCPDTVSRTVIVRPLPSAAIAVLNGNDTVCQNATPPVLVFTGLNGTRPYTFGYRKNNGPVLYLSTSGNADTAQLPVPTGSSGPLSYTLVSVSDSNACSIMVQNDSVNLLINTLPGALVSGSDTVCQNSFSPHITFTGSNGLRPYTFSYVLNNGTVQTIVSTALSDSAGIFAQTLLAPSTANYFLIGVTDANGCSQSLSDTATIQVTDLPNAISTGTDTVCQFEQGVIVAFMVNGGTLPFHIMYNLNGVPDSVTIYAQTDTILNVSTALPGDLVYTINSVSDVYGCISSPSSNNSDTITVHQLPNASITVSDNAVCLNEALPRVILRGNPGQQPFHFYYTDMLGSPQNTFSVPGFDSVAFPVNSTATAGNYTYMLDSVSDAHGCGIGLNDSASIIVHPLPTATLTPNDTMEACALSLGPLLTFTGSNGVLPYRFVYEIGTNAPDTLISTSADTSFNVNTAAADTFVYNLKKVIDGNQCVSGNIDDKAVLVVHPAASLPVIAAEGLNYGEDTLELCNGSLNIGFWVRNHEAANAYLWQADGANVTIGDSTNWATVMSFNNPGTTGISIMDSTVNGCKDTAYMTVVVQSNNDEFIERTILLKQPGNLLLYPDNSMDTTYQIAINDTLITINGYQWGYDPIVAGKPGKHVPIPGMVYQVFVPDTVYLTPDRRHLDTTNYAFWVLLKNGECQSRVYYNGPYARQVIAEEQEDGPAVVSVYPNPSHGDITLSIRGNMYGLIRVRLQNALGQPVYQTSVEKKIPESTHQLHLPGLPGGIYLLELVSADHQHYMVKLIVND